MSDKSRLDKLLVQRRLCRSRNQAQELIEGGFVELQVGNAWTTLRKPSASIPVISNLRIRENSLQKYVSRAALKLQSALDQTQQEIRGRQVLDIGQSTGGFTQVLLERQAARVIGIEVGHDQLAPELRKHPQVTCLEGVNAKNLQSSLLERLGEIPKLDLAVMDVSFISQRLIVPQLALILPPGSRCLCLVKPQFEVGPDKLGKSGIVKDPKLFKKVEQVIRGAYKTEGFKALAYFASAIAGADGNHEFFIHAQRR